MIALTIMFAASRRPGSAPRATPRADAGRPGAARPGALALPRGGFAVSLWLALQARRGRRRALILFGVRAVAASLLALLHLRWL